MAYAFMDYRSRNMIRPLHVFSYHINLPLVSNAVNDIGFSSDLSKMLSDTLREVRLLFDHDDFRRTIAPRLGGFIGNVFNSLAPIGFFQPLPRVPAVGGYR